jgi:hypothetical protein
VRSRSSVVVTSDASASVETADDGEGSSTPWLVEISRPHPEIRPGVHGARP